MSHQDTLASAPTSTVSEVCSPRCNGIDCTGSLEPCVLLVLSALDCGLTLPRADLQAAQQRTL